jgi:tryptophan 2-monooxygenase
MGIHKSIDVYRRSRYDRALEGNTNETWKFLRFNTADFNFNYYKLLEEAEQSSIGRNNDPNIRIAIIGARVAGLTAARELFRCGYINIDIYEPSDSIAGRNYSRPVN